MLFDYRLSYETEQQKKVAEPKGVRGIGEAIQEIRKIDKDACMFIVLRKQPIQRSTGSLLLR